MNVEWVKIRSWHIITNEFTSRGGLDMATTACGRRATIGGTLVSGFSGTDVIKLHLTADDRPGNEKTCETCLRIVGPK